MPRRVVTAPQAAKGLRAAREWLTQPGSGNVGRKRWQNLRDTRKRLRDWPYLGAASDEHPGCYRIVCEGYSILYEIEPDTGDIATAGDVTILVVVHPGAGSDGL